MSEKREENNYARFITRNGQDCRGRRDGDSSIEQCKPPAGGEVVSSRLKPRLPKTT
jgi:hypothetical protein